MSKYRLVITETYRPWWGLGILQIRDTTIFTSPSGTTYEEAEEARREFSKVVKNTVNIRLEEVSE